MSAPAPSIRLFEQCPRLEADVSAKHALLLTLGEFAPGAVPTDQRVGLTAELLGMYRDHPAPGLHGSIEWPLRQRWGKGAEPAAFDAELAGWAKGSDPGRTPKGWYVNGEGQTYSIVRGPVEFTMGSPETESGREAVNEPAHRKRISRSFAVAAREVTVDELLRFQPGHSWVKRYSPDRDSPVVGVPWYAAAAYCNWLSEQEGIPEDQWCYKPNPEKEYGEEMVIRVGHLRLTGYRLPMEAEWEYACRAGASTARHYGRPDDLLPYFAWGAKNAGERAWPVGRLKPNGLGLFDALGNALEWVENPGLMYATGRLEDVEDIRHHVVGERPNRIIRGGAFPGSPVFLRCAYRLDDRPSGRDGSVGFRPARTLLR